MWLASIEQDRDATLPTLCREIAHTEYCLSQSLEHPVRNIKGNSALACLVRNVGQVTGRGCGVAKAENIHELTREKPKACELEGAQCRDPHCSLGYQQRH